MKFSDIKARAEAVRRVEGIVEWPQSGGYQSIADRAKLVALVEELTTALREIAAHRCTKADDCVSCIATAALAKVQS